jgi:hypothetical protein
METRARISEAYLGQQRELHRNPDYGIASVTFAPIVQQIVSLFGVRSVCDYGAGKRRLQAELQRLGTPPFEYFPYDPVFPEYGEARPADLVCCIDVLEHIEPEHLDAVLDELRANMQRVGFLTVHTGAAMKVLPDGRNAHLIQQPSSWWLPRLCRHFEVIQLMSSEGGFWVVVTPKAESAPAPAPRPS